MSSSGVSSQTSDFAILSQKVASLGPRELRIASEKWNLTEGKKLKVRITPQVNFFQ